MRESFSSSSVSCLINADLHSAAEDKKSDPCLQVTQQLHYLIEKVTSFSLIPFFLTRLKIIDIMDQQMT